MIALIALLSFVVTVLVGYAISGWVQQRTAARESVVSRLRSLAGTMPDDAGRSLLKDPRLSGIPLLDLLLNRVLFVRPLVTMIQQAGLKRRAGEVLLYIPLLALIAYLFTTILGIPTILRLACGIVAGLVPIMIIRRMRRKRSLRFAEQLPDALDLVRSALQAGHGLIAAFQVVSETFSDPVAQEFRYVVDEVRLGLPLRDALYNMGARVDDPNVPILVVGILTAQEVGGNMAEVIENITHTVRERERLSREVRVMTAQGRLSGMVLTSLPFLVGGSMLLLTPDYFQPMLKNTLGHYMLAYALISIMLGYLVVRRLVRLEF
jgi:tight adherence protein B